MSPRRLAPYYVVSMALLLAGCGRQDPSQSEAARVKARHENPVEAVRQELAESIGRYQQGDAKALSFLPRGATNISVARVAPSANTSLGGVDAVLLVDGQRHYLEIPLTVSPLVYIETLPPPPAEAEFRQYLAGQVERLLKGEKSGLPLSPERQWTNVVVESLALRSNYTRIYPYSASSVLLIEGLDRSSRTPIHFRLQLEVRYFDEDRWRLSPVGTTE